MSKVGESIIRGLEQALVIEAGTADPSQHIVHDVTDFMSKKRKTKRLMPPIHPGEFLREDFLIPLGMTAKMLASEIKVPARHVVAIVEERLGLDPEMCLRLARYFRMLPDFWMNMQKSYELQTAMEN